MQYVEAIAAGEGHWHLTDDTGRVHGFVHYNPTVALPFGTILKGSNFRAGHRSLRDALVYANNEIARVNGRDESILSTAYRVSDHLPAPG